MEQPENKPDIKKTKVYLIICTGPTAIKRIESVHSSLVKANMKMSNLMRMKVMAQEEYYIIEREVD